MAIDLAKVLEQDVQDATGCTEPIAMALATSIAYNAINRYVPGKSNKDILTQGKGTLSTVNIEKIVVGADRDVIKNANAVGIPGTGEKGMKLAIAMGVHCNPEHSLNLFKDITTELVDKARGILSKGKVEVNQIDKESEECDIHIKATIMYRDEGNQVMGFCEIRHKHTNVTEIRRNDEVLFNEQEGKLWAIKEEEGDESAKFREEQVLISELIDFVERLPDNSRKKVQHGIKLCEELSRAGLENTSEAGVGIRLKALMDKKLGRNLIMVSKYRTAAAADARMAGIPKAAISVAGSGNQGITATMPVVCVADYLGKDEERLFQAVALSYLITSYVSAYTGYLSALCGCTVKAGIGAAAGVAYYLGGTPKQVGNAIDILAADITGIICDGAKEGCALKLATATTVVIESALLALGGLKIPFDNGIVGRTPEESIRNIGKICKAMVETDREIVDIILTKGMISPLGNSFE